MENPFDAPPAGAIPTSFSRALGVQYKANKIEPKFFGKIDSTDFYVQNGNLGFYTWDSETKTRGSLPNFTFVVLEVYSGVSGKDGDKVGYRSNRVLDSRYDEMVVWKSNQKDIWKKGIYQADIKPHLPQGVGYQKFIKAYCLEVDRVVEIELSSTAEKGMQKAIAALEIASGRNVKWEKVQILGLASNDYLWGFSLQGYAQETGDGEPHTSDPKQGNMFYTPVFHAGIVNPVKSADLHAKCVQLQNEERAMHQSYKAKYAAEVAQGEPQEEPQEKFPNNYAFHDNGGINTKVTGSPAASSFPVTNRAEPANNPAVAAGMDGLQEPDESSDSPF